MMLVGYLEADEREEVDVGVVMHDVRVRAVCATPGLPKNQGWN